ncbi:MAG: dihydrolipoamide acetyltransferase family protein [Gemmatimonadales bacterium]
MATKIVMEALSPTMEEGRLVEWKKNEGDPVAVGDVLAEVETDKAVMELVARTSGVLLKQLVSGGATVPVSEPIGWIGTAGETVEGGQTVRRSDGQAVREAPSAAPSDRPAVEPSRPAEPPSRPAAEPSGRPTARVRASPLARRIAAARGVDLAVVPGSGPEGRVIKRDVEQRRPAAELPSRRVPSAESLRRRAGEPAYEDVPLTQIRKTIAKRLGQSIGPIPTFYLTTEVDMERTAEARDALNTAAGDEGKISFNDIVLKAVATALLAHPECNAWWQEDHIRVWHDVHLGVAVAVPDGLITPVVRNAESRSLREIAALTRELSARARERKLSPEEYTGATFSVSNLGMFAIEHFTAVINPPESAILAVGSITPIPVVEQGQVVIRRRMRVTMSCDHRVIDGATGARFLKTLKEMLENPLAML